MKYLLLTLPLALSMHLYAEELLCQKPQAYVFKNSTQKSHYKDCKRNGMTWWYKPDGSIKSEVNFVNGLEEGIYTSYHENGKKKLVINYTHAQKDGIQKIYYDNGVLGSKVKYVMGKREGIMTDWDDEGYKSAEVMYKHNYKVGLKKYYDHKGKVVMTEEYKMDRNPVMLKLLKDKRKEILIDLSKYGLMPKDAPKEERMR